MLRGSALLVSLACLLPAAVRAEDWAGKMFPVSQHEFGTVGRGSLAEFRFAFTNPYVQDVHVAGVRSSCGCTSVRIDKPTVKTHETSAVIATFNTKAFQGQRGATLTVTFDKPFYAEVQLHVSGYIRSDLSLEPGGLQFGTVALGQGGERHLAISHTGSSQWKITGVNGSNPSLRVTLTETARAGGLVSYDLAAKLEADAPVGVLHEYITLVTNDPAPLQIPVAVDGFVQDTLTVSPTNLFLGAVAPGEKATKQLVVKGIKPFRILAIECDDKSFSFDTANTAAPKPLHLVPVTFEAGETMGKIAQKVRIVTDLDGAKAEVTTYAIVGPSE